MGDDLGSRLIAASLVRDLMKLCFLIEKTYAPYTKWFGTAFTKLRCAPELGSVFERVLSANSWRGAGGAPVQGLRSRGPDAQHAWRHTAVRN